MRLKLISILTALLLLPCILSAQEDSAPASTVVKRIGVEEYEQLRRDTNTVALDVRSVAEFEKGRIPGSINIDINSSKFAEKISALDTNKVYLVNCAVGMRSAKACKKMEAMGFKRLYDLQPGFDGWKQSRKPIEK
jgi:rhodanese-related sulfurtransferase